MTPVELMDIRTTLSKVDERTLHYAEAGRAMQEMSHSIRNILQIIGGAAEVIDYSLHAKQMDKVEKCWGILSLNVKRLKKNLLDIIDFTKKQSLDKCECDVNQELELAISSLDWIEVYKKFTIQVQWDSDLPQVEIDPERIGLMTLNLLLHAIDQVSDNDGLIQLRTQYCRQQNQFKICVTDNGRTYSPDLQRKLFGPHEASQQRFSSGIGIALAQQIAFQHEGRIELSLAEGANLLTAILPVKTSQNQSLSV